LEVDSDEKGVLLFKELLSLSLGGSFVLLLTLLGSLLHAQYPPYPPPQPPSHTHNWVVNGSPTCPVFVQNRYPRCGEVIGIGWSSPGIKDWDQCSICGLIQEEGAHLVEATAEGGGVFGHFENGQFVEGYTGVPTAYKSPDTPGVVTLRFKVDDDGNLANDEPTVVEIKITVWDFTITDCPTDWLPEFDKSLDFELEIAPAVDHNGNSLASIINCTLNSSQEPGICNNKLRAEEQFQWDLQFLNPQNDFNVTSSSNEPYKNDKATTKQATTHAKLTVKCYDFGAYGTLTATAYIPNVGMRSARVKGNPGKFVVEIPIDDNNNFIADQWEREQGIKDLALLPTADNEIIPPPDGSGIQVGDGISLYEEYRGFLMEGLEHKRLNPVKKDVFVYDQDNLGFGYFGKLGLEIRENPRMTPDHKVTIFYNSDKHAHDQYAIKLVKDSTMEPPYDILGEATVPGLNSPVVTATIYTWRIQQAAQAHAGENWFDTYEKLLNITIAHELGHGVNLPDHDEQVVCIMNPGPNFDDLDAQTDYCSIRPTGCKMVFLLYLDF